VYNHCIRNRQCMNTSHHNEGLLWQRGNGIGRRGSPPATMRRGNTSRRLIHRGSQVSENHCNTHQRTREWTTEGRENGEIFQWPTTTALQPSTRTEMQLNRSVHHLESMLQNENEKSPPNGTSQMQCLLLQKMVQMETSWNENRHRQWQAEWRRTTHCPFSAQNESRMYQ